MMPTDPITPVVLNKLEVNGFAIIRGVMDESLRLELLRNVEQACSASTAGVRGLTKKIESVGSFARSETVRSLVEPVLGPGAKLVRSIFFNKNEDANWQVAWHQDLAIAVRERIETKGFRSWSNKDGIRHVQPPVQILTQMLNVRLHLDDADETNGALWVSPGSHRFGRLPATEASGVAKRLGTHLCAADAGDVLLFRPLTLHSSRKATSCRPRRVIHLEFAGVSLPPPLQWAEVA